MKIRLTESQFKRLIKRITVRSLNEGFIDNVKKFFTGGDAPLKQYLDTLNSDFEDEGIENITWRYQKTGGGYANVYLVRRGKNSEWHPSEAKCKISDVPLHWEGFELSDDRDLRNKFKKIERITDNIIKNGGLDKPDPLHWKS